MPSLFASTSALLPHAYALDRQATSIAFTPSPVPPVLTLPELPSSLLAAIAPRFVAYHVLEEAVGASHRYVQDQVEGLVKRCVGTARLGPGIVQRRVVHDDFAKATSRPHVSLGIEFDVENLLLENKRDFGG